MNILPVLFAVITCTLLVRLGASISDGEYYKSTTEETKKVASVAMKLILVMLLWNKKNDNFFL